MSCLVTVVTPTTAAAGCGCLLRAQLEAAHLAREKRGNRNKSELGRSVERDPPTPGPQPPPLMPHLLKVGVFFGLSEEPTDVVSLSSLVLVSLAS